MRLEIEYPIDPALQSPESAALYPVPYNPALEHRLSFRAKVFADRVIASIALLALSPLFALLALLIVVDSGRPVFYRQVRVGRGGAHFSIHKFRTMTQGAEHRGLGLHVARDDDRITRVGGWMRRTSLDELAQLVDVALGSMSLVGPRPGLPFQAAAYDARQLRRLEVRPGLTGWAQTHGRNSLTWDERIELDLWYIDHWSPLLDLRAVLATPRALLDGGSVYGPGGVT